MSSGVKNDVFISYNWGHKQQVKEFHDKLAASGLSAWRDEKELLNNELPLSGQLASAIKKSKLFLCFISKKYSQSHNCILEIEYANTLRKKILVLMLENLKMEELDGVGLIIK